MTFRDWMRGVAAVVFCFGLMCLPIGFGANPKRDTSAFLRAADTGVWLKLGVVLIILGVVVFMLSFVFPERR